MKPDVMPCSADEVLRVPKKNVPGVIRTLSRERLLSTLFRSIHEDEWSADPTRRARAREALQHLGFPE